MDACLDEDELLAYALHSLSGEDRASVDEHLEHCAVCFDIVATLVRARPVIAPNLAGTVIDYQSGNRGVAARLPDELGRYCLLDRIGEGGMGVVYRAYDPVLRRHVALKVIRDDGHPASVAAVLRARLLDEAHTMARLTHANVVTVYDVGFVGEQIFIAMELIEGITLRAWQEAQPRTWRAITRHYLQAAQGLSVVHAAGIVHRDFKPDNVLVTADRVIVTDFGLACRAEADAAQQPNGIVGTPAYMAPEQFRGEAADARTDLFSFCCALYEALYGAPPFEGEDYVSRRAAVLERRLRTTPRSARVPRWLRAVLLRGMADHPDDRYQSIDELLSAVQRYLDGARWRRITVVGVAAAALVSASAIVMMPPTPLAACHRRARTIREAWTMPRKHRIEQAFASTGVGFQSTTWAAVRQYLDNYVDMLSRSYDDACDDLHRDGVESHETYERRIACLEDRRLMFNEICSLFDKPDRAIVTQAVDVTARLEPIEACDSIAALSQSLPLPSSPTARAAVHDTRPMFAKARALELFGRYDEAFARVDALVRETRAIGFAPTEAEALLLLGNVERDRGRWRDADIAYEASINAAERGRTDIVRARAMTQLAGVTGHLEGHIGEGQRWADSAAAVLTRVDNPPGDLAELSMRRGLLNLSQGRLDEAEADLRESLRIREQHFASNTPLIAITIANLAAVLDTKGKYDDAESLYRRAYASMNGTFGSDHPRTLAVLVGLGGISYSRGQFKEALEEYERALAPMSTALGATHPNVVATQANIANIYDYLGEPARALAHAQGALANISGKAPDSPFRATLELNIGVYLRSLGRYREARAITDEVLERRRRLLNPTHVLVGEAQYFRALIDLEERRFREAGTQLRTALNIVEAGYGPEHPRVADVLDAIGIVERQQGGPSAALREHSRALSIRERSGAGAERATTMTQVGLDQLALGEAVKARATLEQALALRDTAAGNPRTRAVTEFALARAITATLGFNQRTRSLAETAAVAFEHGGPAFAPQASEVRRWLRNAASTPHHGESNEP